MNEETMEKLFIPFFTTKDVGEGTGLGLAVVHGIITAHDGTIRVSSKIGKGTRFEIRLPLPENGQ
jgi:two-component system NtrC family sensor kinase